MSTKLLVEWVSVAELFLCAFVLLSMWKRKALGDHRFLAAFLAVRAVYGIASISVLFFRKEIGISKFAAYNVYFYSYWATFIMQAILMVQKEKE